MTTTPTIEAHRPAPATDVPTSAPPADVAAPGPETPPVGADEATTSSGSHRRATALLVELRDALWGAAERDVDELASRTPHGLALLTLAARAREAARTLGAPAGTPLTEGPGVVVVRDAASSAALLDAALDPGMLRRLG